MTNKLLVCLDHFVWKTDQVARFCKSINGKWFGIVSTVIICCAIVSFLGTDTLKNIPIIKSTYYDTIVANCPRFVDFCLLTLEKSYF